MMATDMVDVMVYWFNVCIGTPYVQRNMLYQHAKVRSGSWKWKAYGQGLSCLLSGRSIWAEFFYLSNSQKTTYRFWWNLLLQYGVKKPRQCPALPTFFALSWLKIFSIKMRDLFFVRYLVNHLRYSKNWTLILLNKKDSR